MFSRADIPWGNAPPGDGGQFIPIIRAPERGVLECVSVSMDLAGCMVHWRHERTVPCLGDKETCDHCRAHAPKKWVGYLGCWLPLSDRLCLIEVTRDAYLACESIQDGVLPDLRGWHIRLFRARPGRTSRVMIEFVSQVKDISVLPGCWDVRETLERIWSGATRRA